jgi:hypothetical protein
MLTLRKALPWVYALIAAISFRVGLWPFFTAQRHAILGSPRGLAVPALFVVVGTIFAAASWTNLKARASARVWGLAASLTSILLGLLPTILSHRPISGGFGTVLGIGIVGATVFARAWSAPQRLTDSLENRAMPGDWTCNLVNRSAGVIIFCLSLGAYLWWIRWLRIKGIAGFHHSWERTIASLIAVLIITTLHELGHLAAGLACGMKLRAFVSGPFQWRVRDGKWEFHFVPKGLILPEGATGVVSASGKIFRWQHICMMSAGSFVNLVTGVLALAGASLAPGGAPIQAGGMLAIFGAWSVALALGNLLPFRTRHCYSDGATLVQLVAGGPWADYYLALAAIGSSQVSSLRPKDYDIDAIRRAAQCIKNGRQGLLLRLFAFNHFLDCGKNAEAEKAIADAESVYDGSPWDIPAELHTSFVFASAYVRHDARAARAWFERMQTKNPTRFNLDYWRAHSALYWIEGDLAKANDAWEKSSALAKKLPSAGAYEFDRHCSSLLRCALDQSALAA